MLSSNKTKIQYNTGVEFSRKAATSVIQAITGEGFAQGPYVAVRGGVEPTTFRTEGTDNIHLTNNAPIDWVDTVIFNYSTSID